MRGAPFPPGKPSGPGKTAAIVLVAVAAVLIVGLVAIVAVNALSVPGTLASPSTYSPPPTSYTAPTTTSTTTPTPTRVPGTRMPSTPVPPRTVPSPTAVPQTAVPPAPPQPKPIYTLGDNPLFGDFGLPKVQCSWPAWQQDLASQRAFYSAVNACLDRAWSPVLAARNLPFTPPKLRVFDQPITMSEPCEQRVVQPTKPNFQCGDTIYVPARFLPDVEKKISASRDVFFEIAAHEYGHYVQELSGVGTAAARASNAAGRGSAADLLLSRRLELQAQCFSGMFFAAALTAQDFHDAQVDANLRGDYEGSGRKPDHGTRERSGAWFTQGGTKNKTSACNTWPVPADWVE